VLKGKEREISMSMLPSMNVRSNMRLRLMFQDQDDGQNAWEDEGNSKDNDNQ